VTGRPAPAPSCTLLIPTYNWTAALAAVLRTVCAQTVLPTNVFVADDGSAPDTAALVARLAEGFPVPLHHVWQQDAGFRKGRILNEAIARARGDYLIQLDGDMMMHRDFVASHLRFAERGVYLQGGRVMLGPQATARCLDAGRPVVGPFSRDVRNRVNAIHAPLLTRFARGARGAMDRTRGCNYSFWRDDFERVNGYNEAIEGWGREDSELVARLQNAGVRRRNIKFAAVAYHLDHRTLPADAVPEQQAMLERTMRERIVRCEAGLDGHLTSRALG
jgi:glycosyltransferase involved in cell wall biosynthesis